MRPALLALESSPKNDDSFSPHPRRAARAHVPCFGGELRPLTLEELLEAPEKSGTLERVGFMVKGKRQDGGLSFLVAL